MRDTGTDPLVKFVQTPQIPAPVYQNNFDLISNSTGSLSHRPQTTPLNINRSVFENEVLFSREAKQRIQSRQKELSQLNSQDHLKSSMGTATIDFTANNGCLNGQSGTSIGGNGISVVIGPSPQYTVLKQNELRLFLYKKRQFNKTQSSYRNIFKYFPTSFQEEASDATDQSITKSQEKTQTDKLKSKWRLRIQANLDNIMKDIFNVDLMRTKYLTMEKLVQIFAHNEIHFTEEDVTIIGTLCLNEQSVKVNYYKIFQYLGILVDEYFQRQKSPSAQQKRSDSINRTSFGGNSTMHSTRNLLSKTNLKFKGQDSDIQYVPLTQRNAIKPLTSQNNIRIQDQSPTARSNYLLNSINQQQNPIQMITAYQRHSQNQNQQFSHQVLKQKSPLKNIANIHTLFAKELFHLRYNWALIMKVLREKDQVNSGLVSDTEFKTIIRKTGCTLNDKILNMMIYTKQSDSQWQQNDVSSDYQEEQDYAVGVAGRINYLKFYTKYLK
ncbi:UNKNOWN [Stylonychia lemnae]|uniref:EF-hand domain-containing protein n=1 Tax=Stylonychia lemnae TaxID=5949 RepID=A0A078AHD9_STYLE|nr:UNKNOWN [Stylonychia lemnae]|eukprot:CDW80253.1 UNKNOWN [Stylonychia lemnae]